MSSPPPARGRHSLQPRRRKTRFRLERTGQRAQQVSALSPLSDLALLLLPSQRKFPARGTSGSCLWPPGGPPEVQEQPRTPRFRWPQQAVSYTHLRAHETKANLVCRLLLEKKKKKKKKTPINTSQQ